MSRSTSVTPELYGCADPNLNPNPPATRHPPPVTLSRPYAPRMRETLPRIVVVVLLVGIVALPFGLRAMGLGAKRATDAAAPDVRLVITTPHNEQIRETFAAAYTAWRASEGLPAIGFDWRASGGTSDLRKTLLAQYQAKAEAGRVDEGVGVDLFWGGGDYDHGKVCRGIEVRDAEGKRVPVRVAARPTLPAGLLEAAFPEQRIGGERLYRVYPFAETNAAGEAVTGEAMWIGVALSSFGIVSNRDVLQMLGVGLPEVWEDLADPRLDGWVAMADPGHSGSITAALHAVVRRQGWAEGWATLRRVFANSRYFASDATHVASDVASGEAASGMAIDFYGRFEVGVAARFAERFGSPIGDTRAGRLSYVDPVLDGASLTATNADPITLLRGAPNRREAEVFIAWLLTREAQALWQLEAGTDAGPLGVVRHALRRSPARVDVYAGDRSRWTDPGVNPFEAAEPFPAAMPNFFAMIAPVSHAMAIDIKPELDAAWAALAAAGPDHPNRAAMWAAFDAMPDDLTLVWPAAALSEGWSSALRDPSDPLHGPASGTIGAFAERLGGLRGDELIAARKRWTAFFRERYREVVRLAETAG